MTTIASTTTTTTTTDSSTDLEVPQRRPLGLRVRRWLLVGSPVIAGLLAIAGTIADPGSGTTGEEMNRIYTNNPDPLQWKSFLFHWSYAFWIAPALLLAPYVRGKGRALANLAAVLGFTGMTTMPGMLTIDYVDSALGQLYGVQAIGEFHTFIDDTMWGLPAMLVPGLVGFMLSLPVVSLALWRAGLVRWWAPVAVLGGMVAYAVTMATLPGTIVLLGFFTVFAVALERATRDRVPAV